LPLANKKLLNQVFVTGVTGSTGAGVKLQDTTHFSWRNNNISAYKTLSHQHLDEIKQTLESENKNSVGVHFVPWRGDWPRGIFVSATLECDHSLEELYQAYEEFYRDQPFVWVSREAINMKQVVNTNKCAIQLEKQDNMLVVHSAIDNLLKGASGQAIQNMNLMFGFEEQAGLKLKPLAY
jgi:N-acetyl-gamma-glutamyl-phosphate reductase